MSSSCNEDNTQDYNDLFVIRQSQSHVKITFPNIQLLQILSIKDLLGEPKKMRQSPSLQRHRKRGKKKREIPGILPSREFESLLKAAATEGSTAGCPSPAGSSGLV